MERRLRSVPVPIIEGQVWQPQDQHSAAGAPECGLKRGPRQHQLQAVLGIGASS